RQAGPQARPLMLGLLDWLRETLGTGPAVLLLLGAAVATAVLPLWTYRARGAWPVVTARVQVFDIMVRRAAMSLTRAVTTGQAPRAR
ncbi:MAG: hypothetical protein AAFV96_08150, partial [Pseudomonadota bacterium]